MKAKKVLGLLMAVLTIVGTTTVCANETGTDYPIGYWNIAYANRYLIFATDGGSYIQTLEMPRGTVVNVNEYIPSKDGYIFDGWYSDPRTKVERVTEVTLSENIVVYAKWISDGTVVAQSEDVKKYATTEEIMQYGQYTDTKTGVPVTALWVQQNARLKALMQKYNEKFNK